MGEWDSGDSGGGSQSPIDRLKRYGVMAHLNITIEHALIRGVPVVPPYTEKTMSDREKMRCRAGLTSPCLASLTVMCECGCGMPLCSVHMAEGDHKRWGLAAQHWARADIEAVIAIEGSPVNGDPFTQWGRAGVQDLAGQMDGKITVAENAAGLLEATYKGPGTWSGRFGAMSIGGSVRLGSGVISGNRTITTAQVIEEE